MKNNTLQKRIPTTAALLFLLVGLGVTTYLIQTGVIYIGRAGPDKTPANVIISNVSDKSFTVSFTTNSEADSAISVSSNSMEPTTFFDNRNNNSTQGSYSSHYITVANLKPLTEYDFSILSDGQTYLLNGRKYRVRTAPKLINTPKITNVISGKVIMPDASAAGGTIVIADVTGGQTLSTLTSANGSYKIPLKLLRTTNLNQYYSPAGTTKTVVKFMIKDLLTEIKTTVSAARAIPTVTLSYQYNFSPSETTTSTASSALQLPKAQTAPGTISITVPAVSQSFIDNRPQFSGTGVAGNNVAITINPGNKKAATSVGLNGTWTYRVEPALNPGRYTLKIETPDTVGATKSISQTFNIFASGSQIAGSGPTVTPTPITKAAATATPTRTPSPTPTSAPAATPTTTFLSPTPIQSGPTATPSPTPPVASPTLFANVPESTPTVVPTKPAQMQPTSAQPFTTPAPTGTFATIAIGLVSILLVLGGTALLFIL